MNEDLSCYSDASYFVYDNVSYEKMNKRKISQLQQRRITKSKEKHIQRLKETEKSSQPEESGLLVAHYGSYVDIENQSGQLFRCNLRQNLGVLVAGDRVVWSPTSENTGILVAVLPRHSLLMRSVSKTKIKPIAANISLVILVIAPEPKPSTTIIDSYLVALENIGLSTLLVFNKSDLINNSPEDSLMKYVTLYQEIGYPVLLMSALSGQGLTELKTLLQNQTSILVGQSGVGKSSLLARLVDNPESIKTASVDHATHTTTTARLYHLTSGGDLIDSPGIREFSLGDLPTKQIAQGFKEFQPYLTQCKYRNCIHLNEEGCAILQAVKENKIAASRLANYQRMMMVKE